MLKRLNDLIEQAFGGAPADTPVDRDHALQVATAMLLVEVARADYAEDLSEDQAVFASIKEFFALSDDETTLLIEDARRQADHAVSLQMFTRRLTEQLSAAERQRVVEMLWKVALADQRLDKYEDYVVRKVADLLYVPHSDLIRIRNRVRDGGT
jgi:uncharacterized tellurite resistance protein B-like protein